MGVPMPTQGCDDDDDDKQYKGKSKAIPLEAWTDSEGSRRLYLARLHSHGIRTRENQNIPT